LRALLPILPETNPKSKGTSSKDNGDGCLPGFIRISNKKKMVFLEKIAGGSPKRIWLPSFSTEKRERKCAAPPSYPKKFLYDLNQGPALGPGGKMRHCPEKKKACPRIGGGGQSHTNKMTLGREKRADTLERVLEESSSREKKPSRLNVWGMN